MYDSRSRAFPLSSPHASAYKLIQFHFALPYKLLPELVAQGSKRLSALSSAWRDCPSVSEARKANEDSSRLQAHREVQAGKQAGQIISYQVKYSLKVGFTGSSSNVVAPVAIHPHFVIRYGNCWCKFSRERISPIHSASHSATATSGQLPAASTDSSSHCSSPTMSPQQ